MDGVSDSQYVGWVAEPHKERGTASLLYSCLFTIFICTWSAVHLNVPADGDSALYIVLRKIEWMIITILAPEYTATNAFRDWRHAKTWMNDLRIWSDRQQREYRRDCRRNRIHRYGPKKWTMTHAYFIKMGGFSAEIPNGTRYRLLDNDFRNLIDGGMKLPFISEEDIQDKSKASWLTKGLAYIQISWFVAQLIGRAIQKLPASSLEAFTLAIVVCTLISYLLWWEKPLDVSKPIVIKVHQYPLQSYSYVRKGALIEELAAARQHSLQPFSLFHPDRALFITAVALAFGACHLIAWNWSFPSHVERILWRVASIGCALLPVIFCLAQALDPNRLMSDTYQRGISQAVDPIRFDYIIIPPYIICRVYLLVEVFAGLRSMPRGVYTTVYWSQYLPHF